MMVSGAAAGECVCLVHSLKPEAFNFMLLNRNRGKTTLRIDALTYIYYLFV